MVLGDDISSGLNLAINKDGIKMVYKQNNLLTGYIKIAEKCVIQLNYVASYNEKNKISKTLRNNSWEFKINTGVIIKKKKTQKIITRLI